VSISSTARVGAEVSSARQSATRGIAEGIVAQEILEKAEAAQETPEAQVDESQDDDSGDKPLTVDQEPSTNDDGPTQGIDTVA